METITRRGQKFVLVPVQSWERLTQLPPLPRQDANGNVDAVEYARASIARGIISRRMAMGMTQADLSRESGVRVETLNRIERAKVTPDTRTLVRIDKALQRFEKCSPRQEARHLVRNQGRVSPAAVVKASRHRKSA
ncbi:MAG TPA: helix-turn-helix transcriptional regulator [Tepidisphaeraceae bacterium]|nr:helix-turn-helix transcriptional regulator [Tepidisphaeraceae bacterium]